jgi:hypothetical protein
MARNMIYGREGSLSMADITTLINASIVNSTIYHMSMYLVPKSWDRKRINYGIITLLPKVKEAKKIQQFRHICLLNCQFKWFTKCLT